MLCVLLAAGACAAPPCPSPCECYTTAQGLLAANCTDLPADDGRVAAWPQKILRVRFADRGAAAAMLKNHAFHRFPELTCLDVAGGPVRYVGNAAFAGLPELVELNLVSAGLRRLHRDTFAGNRKLAFLSLRDNPRLSVGPSFLASESVAELDVSACSLTALKSVYFDAMPGLKYLLAADNLLTTVGPQFAPAALKYADLSRNRIQTVTADLAAYKRLRTVDMTGNPVNCTCELAELDRQLTARGVAFGNTVTCRDTGAPLADTAEACADDVMMGDDASGGDMYQADHLLKIDKDVMQNRDTEDVGSGSGSGDGDPAAVGGSSSSATDALVPAVEKELTKTHATEDPTTTSTATTTTTKADESDATSSSTAAPADAITAAVQTPAADPERNIVPGGIKAPEETDDDGDDVQAKVLEYVRSNVGVTVTAAVLAVVLAAIVYKAVCAGKSRSRRNAAADQKNVELKEIKYAAADTEDRTPAESGPAEQNRLLDEDDDTDGDDDDDGGGSGRGTSTSSPPPPPPREVADDGHGGGPANGLLHSVMDAMNNAGDAGDPNVPKRVVVKLTETPKASKPVTVDNVH